MASFPKMILTNAGKNMIVQAQLGQELIFTKGKYGNGALGGQDQTTFTDLLSPMLDLPIQSMTSEAAAQATITVKIDRTNLNTGFFGRELGLFAKIGPSGTEQLFCYTNADSQADFIPDKNDITIPYDEFIDIVTTIGNATSVNIIYDQTAVYVTPEELDTHNTNPAAHINALMPVGSVIFLASPILPVRYLKMNGAAISRITYDDLFAVIGTIYGAGNGSTTFNLPDARGEFFRGWDDGRGVDSGRALGSAQGDAIRNITGTTRSASMISSTNAASTRVVNSGAFVTDPATLLGNCVSQSSTTLTEPYQSNFDASRVVPTANENRPRNIALLACIKY